MASVHKISPFLLFDGPVEEANRVMQAVFKMKKIVVADLDRAAAA